MSYVFFDVGANWGHDSLPVARDNQHAQVWAFEPTPELTTHLREQSANFAQRYNIVEVALSDYDGTAKFGISDQPGSDWGCSSLNTFNEGVDEKWPGFGGFGFTRHIDVKVMKLETWFNETKPEIEKIDYFHCDTQGSDLKVLQGMGEYIHLIQEGVVECAADEEGKLYKENHTLGETVRFLISKGFFITRIEANDRFGHEMNVTFRKKQ